MFYRQVKFSHKMKYYLFKSFFLILYNRHQLLGSLGGAPRLRKDIEGALWLTQVRRKLTVERKSTSQPDVILKSMG